MKNKLEEIENTMFCIFNKNINFLKNSFPKIYNKIIDFENKNINKYNINFVNNHFDIIDESDKYIYNCDPYYDAEYRFAHLEKSNSSFVVIKIDTEYNKTKTYSSQIDVYKILNSYIKLIIQNNVDIAEKFIFLGSLLGIHISEIVKKSKYKVFLIIEDNIEMFRLSMFLNDYEDICTNKKVFFAIDENNKEVEIQNFLLYLPEYNNKIKFELASEKEIYLIEELSNVLIQENELNYPFSEYLISYLRGIEYINKKYNILKLNERYTFLKNSKILFLGAGLSLEKEINFIVKNKNNFILVCVAATLKILEKHSLVPDIIITSDSSTIIKEQFNVSTKYYENSLILASNKTSEVVINLFNPEKVFFFNDSIEIFKNTGVNIGVNVGNIGYSILLKLGVAEIYLIGFDACIDEISKKSHSSSNEIKNYKTFDLFKDTKINSEENLIKVKGNFREFVYATSHFKLMIDSFYKIKDNFKVNAYNLSDGAFLEGIIPLKSSQIISNNIKKDELLVLKLKNFLLSISKNSFDSSEVKYLENELSLIDKLKYLDKTDLYKDFEKVYINNKSSLILQILNKYFLLVLPYYSYLNSIENNIANDLFINDFENILDYIYKNFKLKVK